MSLAEAAKNRELVARVDSLERALSDLTRRMDEMSKASRLLADQIESRETVRLKKSG